MPKKFTLDNIEERYNKLVPKEAQKALQPYEHPDLPPRIEWESMGQRFLPYGISGWDYMPFIGAVKKGYKLYELNEYANILKDPKATKLEKEEALDQINRYRAVQEYNAARVGGVGKVMSGVMDMPAFMIELFATGPVAAGIKAGATKVGGRIVGKAINSAVGRALTTILGEGARAMVLPQRVFESAQRQQLPADLGGKGRSPVKAWLYGFLDTWVETVSEASGDALSAGAGKLLGKFPNVNKLVPKQVRAILKSEWLKGGKTGETFNKVLKKGGFHGVIEEMGEEQLGRSVRAILDVEQLGLSEEDNTLWNRLVESIPSGEELLIEAATFAVPGVVGGIASHAREKKLIPQTEADREKLSYAARLQRLAEKQLQQDMKKELRETELLKREQEMETKLAEIEQKKTDQHWEEEGVRIDEASRQEDEARQIRMSDAERFANFNEDKAREFAEAPSRGKLLDVLGKPNTWSEEEKEEKQRILDNLNKRATRDVYAENLREYFEYMDANAVTGEIAPPSMGMGEPTGRIVQSVGEPQATGKLLTPETEQMVEWKFLPVRPKTITEAPKVEPASTIEKPTVPQKRLQKSMLTKAFPGRKVEETDTGFKVYVGDSFIDVQEMDEISMTREQATQQLRDLGRLGPKEELSEERYKRIKGAGSFQLMPDGGTATTPIALMRFSRNALKETTTFHEAFHFAFQSGMLNKKERAALLKKYGSEEAAAEALGKLGVTNKERSKLTTKILQGIKKMLRKMGFGNEKAEDIEALLQRPEFWERPTEGEAQGPAFELVEEPYGRPDLARMSETEGARRLEEHMIQAYDREGNFAPETMQKWNDEAEARLQADYAGERARIVEMGKTKEPGNSVDRTIAHKIWNREVGAVLESGDDAAHQDLNDIVEFKLGIMTTAARTLRSGHDPMESPEERRFRSLTEALLSYDPETRKKIDKAEKKNDTAEVQRLRKRWLKQVAEIKDRAKALGLDFGNLGEIYQNMKDPVTAAKMLGLLQTAKASKRDKLFEYWRNSILSAPTTQIVNLVGNYTHGAWHYLLERPLEALINKFRWFGRRKNATTFTELKHVYKAVKPSLGRSWRNALKAMDAEVPILENQLNMEGTMKIEEPSIAIKGKLGRVIRYPQRLLLMADEMFKGMVTNMEVAAQAYRIAREVGLEGEALDNAMKLLVADTNSAAWSSAMKHAQKLAFQEPLTGAGALAVKIRKDVPMIRYIMPFITTPYNIFKLGLSKSPLGSVTLLGRAIKNMSLDGLQPQMAEQLVAWGVVFAVLSTIDPEDPWITGTKSEETYGGRLLARRARPAQSINIGGTWYSYARVEPFATGLSMVVDLIDDMVEGKELNIIKSGMKNIQSQIKSKTFMQGIGEIMKMFEARDPEEQVGQIASGLTVSWVPNVVRSGFRSTQVQYPYRGVWGEEGDWWKRLGKRTLQKTELGLISDAPGYDMWGRRAKRNARTSSAGSFAMNFFVPFREKLADVYVGDKVILQWNFKHRDEQYLPQMPQKYIKRAGQKHWLNDEQYARYTRLAGEMTRKIVSSIDFKDPLDAKKWKIKAIQKAVKKGRAYARGILLPELLKKP